MKSFLTAAAVTLMAAGAFAGDAFMVDRSHSEATFQIRHLVSRVSGRFNDFTGAINIDKAKPADSSVEFTIKATSIDTGTPNRDNDLRGANFFEVDKFPEITFKSSSIKPSAKKDVYDVTGEFTMHGVTKTITLPVEFLGFIKDPRGNEKAGFSARTTLNRKDYGIVWNRTLDAGSTLLSDDVDISVNIESTLPKAPPPAATSTAPAATSTH